MRWRPSVGDERQELALADGSQWRRPCLELRAEIEMKSAGVGAMGMNGGRRDGSGCDRELVGKWNQQRRGCFVYTVNSRGVVTDLLISVFGTSDDSWGSGGAWH